MYTKRSKSNHNPFKFFTLHNNNPVSTNWAAFSGSACHFAKANFTFVYKHNNPESLYHVATPTDILLLSLSRRRSSRAAGLQRMTKSPQGDNVRSAARTIEAMTFFN